MDSWNTEQLVADDKRYGWHPFTSMGEWCARIEPVIQGAAGMKIRPAGTLRWLREWCNEAGTLLIGDEVMTGFGRTRNQPNLYIFAKGFTGGYLLLTLTLMSQEVFEILWNDRSD